MSLNWKKNAASAKAYRERKNPDKLKLKQAASSKAYRDRKKIEKFSNIESEMEPLESQYSTSHRHTQVKPAAENFGKIQNVQELSQQSRRFG